MRSPHAVWTLDGIVLPGWHWGDRMTALYVGVSAGSTKTDAIVCDPTGQVHGYGRAAGGDISDGTDRAVEEVLAAVESALAAADAEPTDVARAAFRLAGVDWPEDHALWSDAFQRRLPEISDYSIANDGFAAIRCGEPSGHAVAIVIGTGAAVVGRGPGGSECSLSFWVDGGMGAGGLVTDALRAVYHAELGLGPATQLTERLLTYFGHVEVESLLHGFARRDGRPADAWLAAAAPEVTRAAARGDDVALRIITDHAARYADYARVAAVRVGFDVDDEPVPIVLAGSALADPSSPLIEALQMAFVERFAGAAPRPARLPPVCGAVLDAMAEAGDPITPDVIASIVSSAEVGAGELKTPW
jgi:N-acetylglucosamine kinase-like BadF-type ATPase